MLDTPLSSPRAFEARLRAELHQLVRALSRQDWQEAEASVWHPASESELQGAEDVLTTADAIRDAMGSYFDDYEKLPFTQDSRRKALTRIDQTEAGHWVVRQTLLDPEGDGLWCLEGEVHLDVLSARSASAHELGLDRPIFRLLAVTT